MTPVHIAFLLFFLLATSFPLTVLGQESEEAEKPDSTEIDKEEIKSQIEGHIERIIALKREMKAIDFQIHMSETEIDQLNATLRGESLGEYYQHSPPLSREWQYVKAIVICDVWLYGITNKVLHTELTSYTNLRLKTNFPTIQLPSTLEKKVEEYYGFSPWEAATCNIAIHFIELQSTQQYVYSVDFSMDTADNQLQYNTGSLGLATKREIENGRTLKNAIDEALENAAKQFYKARGEL